MRFLLSLACLILFPCCSSGGDGPSTKAPDTALSSEPDVATPDVEAAPDQTETAAPEPETPVLPQTLDELIGTWAVLTRVSVIQDVEAPGIEPHTAVTLSFGLGEIAQVDDGFVLEESYCHLEINAGFGGAAPTIPTAWPQSMEPFVGALSDAADGGWDREEVVQVVGAVLPSPETDPLPTQPDDPQVVDQDEDGQPGVTAVMIGIGDMYLTRRERYAYHGLKPVTADRLLGLIDDTSEQTTLGASNWALNLPVSIVPDPDAAASTVELVRIPEGTDCDGLIAMRGDLFLND